MKKDMTKYDYLSILSTFDEKRYRLFSTISQNDEYVSNLIYKNIIDKTAGTSELFLNSQETFIKWLSSYPLTGQDVSILDAEVIGFLDRDKEFSEIYKGSLEDINHIMYFLIIAWSNKTKKLSTNLNKLQMIYQRYLKFIMSDKGQDFLYGKSLDLIPDFDSTLAYEDKPFYEQQAYKQKQLLLLKKKTILKCCKSPFEVCEMRALWDVTFNADKFTYLQCAAIVRKYISEQKVSKTALYYHLKRLRVEMMQYILDNYDDYLENSVYSDSKGQLIHIKDVLLEFLVEATYDFEKTKINSDGKIFTNTNIAETVANWCDMKGIRYNFGTGKVLIKLKMNADGLIKKSWKLFIFKGGGWYCHSTGKNGFITDLIPLNYFSNKIQLEPIKKK